MGIQLAPITSANRSHDPPRTTESPPSPAVKLSAERPWPDRPFSGSGATGKVAGGSIPWIDTGVLFAEKVLGLGDKLSAGGRLLRSFGLDAIGSASESAAAKLAVTVESYQNPIWDGDRYLAELGPLARVRQARELLERPIFTVDPARYGGNVPSRAEVIAEAAQNYRLDPRHVAAIILAEQRDQSANEDEKDIRGATSWAAANTSIGLGQITVGTAKKDGAELLSDLLPTDRRAQLSHAEVAKYLQSEDHNIWATAKYIRRIADEGSKKTAAELPETAQLYPGIEFARLAADSKEWTRDHLELIGSEYTSKAWDDRLVPSWGKFVADAADDVSALHRVGLGGVDRLEVLIDRQDDR